MTNTVFLVLIDARGLDIGRAGQRGKCDQIEFQLSIIFPMYVENDHPSIWDSIEVSTE